MIEITDKTTNQQPYWEITDTASKKTTKINYDPNDLLGYDRVRVLRQIVDYHAMTGLTNPQWQKGAEGKVLTIS